VTSEEPPPLVTSKTSPALADIKADWLDPALRELGLDPDRYELAYEPHEPLPIPAPQPLTGQQELARAAAAQTLATGLGLPPEILGITPNHWDPWWRSEEPTAEVGDRYGIGAFERTRRFYMPRWRYVSGGKVLHAFIGDSDRPACGVDPRRGRDRHPARWIDSSRQGTAHYWTRRRGEHGPCARAVRAHRNAMLQGGAT
jgi:hypothetical protein